MNNVNHFYKEIYNLLLEADSNLAKEFLLFTEKHNPKEVYLWLHDKEKSIVTTEKFRAVMTDFFFSIH